MRMQNLEQIATIFEKLFNKGNNQWLKYYHKSLKAPRAKGEAYLSYLEYLFKVKETAFLIHSHYHHLIYLLKLQSRSYTEMEQDILENAIQQKRIQLVTLAHTQLQEIALVWQEVPVSLREPQPFCSFFQAKPSYLDWEIVKTLLQKLISHLQATERTQYSISLI